MSRGRPKDPLVVTREQRSELERLASRRKKTAQSLALRVRIVLACAQGAPTKRRVGVWGEGRNHREVAAAFQSDWD